MIQEEKELLLKDLSARLRCGVIIQLPELFTPSVLIDEKLKSIDDCYINDSGMPIETVKPYLRPMSSMTDEEDARRCAFLDDIEGGIENAIFNYIDWLISNHFDYHGLIPMGLALEAPEGMYKS